MVEVTVFVLIEEVAAVAWARAGEPACGEPSSGRWAGDVGEEVRVVGVRLGARLLLVFVVVLLLLPVLLEAVERRVLRPPI